MQAGPTFLKKANLNQRYTMALRKRGEAKLQSVKPKTGEGRNSRIAVPMTKPELEVAMILNEAGIKFHREWKMLSKFYDFFLIGSDDPEIDAKLKKVRTLIEVDGTYFHFKNGVVSERSIRQRTEDIYKNILAQLQGYKLIRIWEDEIDKDKLISQILMQ